MFPVSTFLIQVLSNLILPVLAPPPPNNPVVSVRSLTSVGIVGASVRSL